jgi:hypothetical protein
MAEEISTQIVREAKEIEAYKLGLLKEAQGLYKTPLNLPAQEAAALSGTTTQAIDLAKQGIGAYQPYLDAASAGITQGQNIAGQGANVAAGVNAAPTFANAQGIMGQGVTAAGGIGQAANLAGQFTQANLNESQGVLGRAAGMSENAIGAGVPAQTAAMGTVGQGIAGYNAATGGYDTATTQRFMNPYQEQVTQNALKEMRRQGDIASQGTAAQAVRSGAFGGTREGVQRAEQERNLQDLMSQRVFQDMSANYGQAQAAGMTSFEQERQRQLAAAQGITNAGATQSNIGTAAANIYGNAANTTANIGNVLGSQAISNTQLGQTGSANIGNLAASQAATLGNLGQGIGALGTQQANIDLSKANTMGNIGSNIANMGTAQGQVGEAVQRAGITDVNLLSGIGSIEQQNAQNQIDAARNTKLQEAMAPYQQLGFVSDIYKNAPTSQMSMTSASAPSPSTFQTVAGTVLGGVTTAAAANKAGLF